MSKRIGEQQVRFKQNLTALLKWAPLLFLTIGFYQADLFLLWNRMASLVSGIYSALLLLVLISIYQKRDALRVLSSTSRTKSWFGLVLLVLAVMLYAVGSYTSFSVWFHLYSMLLLIIAYLIAEVDYGIPRLLSVPFLALLLMVTLQLVAEILQLQRMESQLITFLGGSIIFVALLSYLLWNSNLLKPLNPESARAETVDSCTHELRQFLGLGSCCQHCGKVILPERLFSTKSFVVRFAAILLILGISSSAYIPVFYWNSYRVYVESYTIRGTMHQPLVSVPYGWYLNSTSALKVNATSDGESVLVKRVYHTLASSDTLLISVMISNVSSNVLDVWLSSGWTATQSKQLGLSGDVNGQLVLLEKNVEEAALLTSTMRLLLHSRSSFSGKYVTVSWCLNASQPMSESKIDETFRMLENVALQTVGRWTSINTWTNHALKLSQLAGGAERIFDRFKEIFAVTGVVFGVFILAVWVRTSDDQLAKAIENTFLSLESDPYLLIALSRLRRRFTGQEFYMVYRRLVKDDNDIDLFYSKLSNLLRLDLITVDYMIRNSELTMVFKKNVL